VWKSSRVLFLHGGPGLNAELERRRFGSSLPVHWWDQPQVSADESAPYDRLVNAALEELQRVSSRDGGPVGLLASSFGVHLALALIERAPATVGNVSIVGGVLDLRTAFVRLGRRVAEKNQDQDLAAATLRADQSPDSASLWRLIERLFSVTNLLDLYWSPTATAQRDEMKATAAEGTLLHVPTYQAVLRDFLARQRPCGLSGWCGAASVWIGRHDPYALPDDTEPWRTVLPSASVTFVDAGHFPHLELPPSVWLPFA
jgi:predicted alpha/beta hydrolase family esterase